MKEWILGAIGVIGSYIAGLVGGWDYSIITLMIFMAVDYLSGLLLAGVFKKSTKTESGGLESKAGFKGLVKKGIIIAIVGVAHRLDGMLGYNYLRDAVCMTFIVNELISIVENVGLMGIPLPKAILNAIDQLKSSQESASKIGTIIKNTNAKAEKKAQVEYQEQVKETSPEGKVDDSNS